MKKNKIYFNIILKTYIKISYKHKPALFNNNNKIK